MRLRRVRINYYAKLQLTLELSSFLRSIIIVVRDDRQIRVKGTAKASNYRTDRFYSFSFGTLQILSRWHNRGGKTLITRPKETARSFGKGGGEGIGATSRVFILASVHNWRIPLSSLLPRITEPRCTRGTTRERPGVVNDDVGLLTLHGRVPSWYSHTRVQTPAPAK